MPHRFSSNLDVVTILMVHVSAVGITLLDIEIGLKLASLVLAIGYTTWRWANEYKKRK